MDQEAQREFNEGSSWEEWWEASRKLTGRPCPACGMIVEDPDGIACEACMAEWDDELQV